MHKLRIEYDTKHKQLARHHGGVGGGRTYRCCGLFVELIYYEREILFYNEKIELILAYKLKQTDYG